LVGDKKLSGLLTEISPGTGNTSQLVVGIGINYTNQSLPETHDYQSVSVPMLCENAPSRAELIADICVRIQKAYATFLARGWSAFSEQWKQYDYLAGRTVRVVNGEQQQIAVAQGVDDNGALLIEANGKHSTVYSGEVSVRIA